MKTFTKFAIAACVLFAILGGISLIDKGSGIALADVVQRVERAKVFFYKMLVTTTGESSAGSSAPMNMDGSVWISTDLGMKMEMNFNGQPGSITYLLPGQKKMVSVMPAMKKYMEIELTDDLLSKMKQQNQDPREWLRKMVDSQYKSLGKSTLDGIEVEGFETTDPAIAGGVTENVLARLWVDVKTGYPIQMEMDFDMNEGKTKMHSVIHDFQWNMETDAATFTPQIGSDYTPLPKMQMPKMDEQSAIAGLKIYLDITGRYPESLSMMAISDGIQKATRDGTFSKNSTIDPNQFKGLSKEEASKMAQEQAIKKSMDMMMPIQSISLFYMTLTQEKKDPAYYGKTVTPGDGQSVLLRWKSSDTTYKVIMGDLSVTEMSEEQLKQIEPQIQSQEQSVSAPTAGELAIATDQAGQYANRTKSMTNIKKMLLACLMYSDKNNGHWPDTLESLLEQGIEADILINPSMPNAEKGYIYIKPQSINAVSQPIVIYESHETWGKGINAGFADGHVEFIPDEADFQKRLSQ